MTRRPEVPAPSQRAEFGHVPVLDFARMVAVLLVITAHFDVSRFIPGGFGVTIFFFISGFLISRLLLAECREGLSVSRFYIRRFLRLTPPLVIMAIPTLTLYSLIAPEELVWPRITAAFLYLGNFYNIGRDLFGWPEGVPGYGLLWSLAIEEHFYLLIPLLLLLVRGSGHRILIFALLVTMPLMLRFMVFLTLEGHESFNYYFTVTRFDSLAWGCLLTAMLADSKWQPWVGRLRQYWIAGGGGALICASLLLRDDLTQSVLCYSMQGLGLFLIANVVLFDTRLGLLRWVTERSAFRFLGRISYEMYLWHLHARALVLLLVLPAPITASLSIILTLILSAAAYSVSTHYTRNWRKRFSSHRVASIRSA
ncbi:acyltransferase family protein [Sphingomonas japonica]|uniref:Peptidoglycan/LPS O-acetylase OafA/YrhL n=1 Tax=Sphingomonas japonica TaxID=511662 RepID=A0ABX0U5M9_9SPHN|nr:acyltransferase [Sphingomonas japonica]NIJ25159.1 peptidoglycan/LPS O-acetylase OafA/YrhL [Sphingomonas japonica]